MNTLVNGSWTRQWAGFAPTVLRVATGVVFAMHGYQKLTVMGLDDVTGLLASLGFPMASVFAVILIAIELAGGIALILGLFTYPAALLTAAVALVGLFKVHLANGFFMPMGYEFILMLFAASVALMLMGPGRWSAAELLRNR